MVSLCLCCFFIIFISAIASGTEAALFSISVSKLKSLPPEKRGVKATLKIKKNIDSSIRTIVIINNITNITGSMIVGFLAEKEFQDWDNAMEVPYVGIFSAIFTLLIISFKLLISKTCLFKSLFLFVLA